MKFFMKNLANILHFIHGQLFVFKDMTFYLLSIKNKK